MRLLVLLSVVSSVAFGQVVPWRARTPSIPSAQAADPAVVSNGLGLTGLVGTDPAQVGLYLYALDGQLFGPTFTGGVRSADALGEVLVASASILQELKVFRLQGGGLVDALEGTFNVPTPTALAVGPGDGGLLVWVDDSSQELRKVALTPTDGGRYVAATIGTVPLPRATAGVALDPRTGTVYASLASLGIVAVENDVPRFLVSIDGGDLGPIIGGLDVYPLSAGGVLLFSTSPSTAEVVVHQVSVGGAASYLGRFSVGASADGGGARVQLPQHLDVFAGPLPGLPSGALVLHDGVLANYAVVGLDDVARAFSPPLPLTSGAGGGGGGGGGSPGDAGAGGGGGSAGVLLPDGGMGLSKPPPSSAPDPGTGTGCGCTAPPVVALPTLLLLWWIRRLRS